jgi:hypothetical protein
MNITRIHRPVLYLKHIVSETGFCLCLHLESTYLDPIDRAGLCLPTPAIGISIERT